MLNNKKKHSGHVSRFFITLITLVIAESFLFSCATYRYVYLKPGEFNQVKKIYILSTQIDNYSHLPENTVIYYSSSYVKEALLNGFRKQFNSNEFGYRFEFLNLDQQEKLFSSIAAPSSDTKNSQNIRLEPFTSDNIEGVMPVLIKGRWIKENTSDLDAFAFATLQVKTSVWKQSIEGFLKIYNTSGELILRMQLKDFSPYIILDKDSPYIPKNRLLAKEKVNDNSYYYELNKVYQILGEKIAQLIIDRFTIMEKKNKG